MVESIVCLNMKTTHEMKLHASPFEKIKSGTKTIELRLYDEKRQKIKAGDDIIFTNTVNGEKMYATVKKLHRFNSFEELYKTLPLLQCGYTAEDVDTAHPSDMEQYYSAEEQKQYGVVGIELFPPKRITDEIVVKSYIESRLDFFKVQRDKAKRRYERVAWQFKKIERPTPEDIQKMEEAAEEYNYYIDVVILLERTPVDLKS